MSASLFKKRGAGLFQFQVEIPKLNFWIQSRGEVWGEFQDQIKLYVSRNLYKSHAYQITKLFENSWPDGPETVPSGQRSISGHFSGVLDIRRI